MNVLVIENDADATANLREILAFDGYGVTAVRTAREATEQEDWSEVGAILAVGSPVDGTLEALLPNLGEIMPQPSVMVITSHPDLLDAITFLRNGTSSALSPINPVELRRNLARLTGLRAKEQQVVQAARLAAVGELSASVAHELNNSFGTVLLRLEGLLAKTPENDARRHALEVVDQEIGRMADLVNDLLEFARAGRGQLSTVDLCDEVTRTLDLTDHHLSRRGVRIEPVFAQGVPHVQADRQHLRQVLLNLINNAADAMSEGGRLTIRVQPAQVRDRHRGVMIEVIDTGTGIPPEVLPRVMEPFFTTKAEGKGTGLGLAICKRIVEQHGGTMTIESGLGMGTTVRIGLPLHSQEPSTEKGDTEVPVRNSPR